MDVDKSTARIGCCDVTYMPTIVDRSTGLVQCLFTLYVQQGEKIIKIYLAPQEFILSTSITVQCLIQSASKRHVYVRRVHHSLPFIIPN